MIYLWLNLHNGLDKVLNPIIYDWLSKREVDLERKKSQRENCIYDWLSKKEVDLERKKSQRENWEEIREKTKKRSLVNKEKNKANHVKIWRKKGGKKVHTS
jgi:hypothetical protein